MDNQSPPENPPPPEPWHVRFSLTDWITAISAAISAVATVTIMVWAGLQWWEMHSSGSQTDKLISAANQIEEHQKHLVADNKQGLLDNRNALSASLEENRKELAEALRQNRDALKSQTTAASGELTALQQQTEISERPWIKITPKIIEPLTFNVMRNAGLVATMTTENIVENVGQSVALNVLSWEDA